MDERLTSRITGSRGNRRAQAITEEAEGPAHAVGFADAHDHPESPSGTASAGGPASSGVDEAQPRDDVWDPETWSGPEQSLLTIVALVAPFVLWFSVVDHLPEVWVDGAAILILGVGDLVAGVLFVFVYGSARALLRPVLTGSSNRRQVGRHRR